MSPNPKPTAPGSKVIPRMRQALRALVAGGLGFAVSFIAACGSSSGLLSSSDANNLTGQLQQISSDLGAHNCAAATTQLTALSQTVNNLPSSVNGNLLSNLTQGIQRLQNLAARECPSATTSSTATTTTTQTNTTSTTATTTPTTTSTPTRTTSTPTTTTATTPTSPGTTTSGPGSGGTGLGGSGNGGGGSGGPGNGNGNGNGNGGNGG